MVKSKKMAALILAAMLAVSSSAAMAVTVSAEEDTAVTYSSSDTKSWGDYDYRILDDGTVEITLYGGYDEIVVIPSEIDGKKVTSIGTSAFNNTSDYIDIISIQIPDSVVNIGDNAFAMCESLTSINIPNSVRTIGKDAFNGCCSLTDIKIPYGVTEIKPNTFIQCCNLEKIDIPNSITSIGEFAFSGCTKLEDLTIPSSVTNIGNSAFGGCDKLKDVTIPNSVTNIGNSPFAFCSNLLSINVSENNTCYSSLNGILFNKEKTELLEYPAGKSGEYVIPNDVISISDSAFAYCYNLTNIIIPDSVKDIGDNAFWGCENLTSIEIPDSVTSIGDFAFSCCKNLTSVIIPNSVTSIGRFYTEFSTVLTIYGCSGSSAETFAKENNLPFVDIYSKVLTSKVGNISVKGAFDDGVTLNVEKATVKNAVAAYDITLKDENGNTIQPSGKITVSIPSDKANCKVYWIKEDGTKVDMNATYNNGNYEFTTDHLSIYALLADTSKSGDSNNSQSNTTNNKTTSETGKNGVETGDSNNLFAMAAMLTGAITAISTIIFKKKRT